MMRPVHYFKLGTMTRTALAAGVLLLQSGVTAHAEAAVTTAPETDNLTMIESTGATAQASAVISGAIDKLNNEKENKATSIQEASGQDFAKGSEVSNYKEGDAGTSLSAEENKTSKAAISSDAGTSQNPNQNLNSATSQGSLSNSDNSNDVSNNDAGNNDADSNGSNSNNEKGKNHVRKDKKVSVGAAIARDMFPATLNDANEDDEKIDSLLALVHDPNVLTRKAVPVKSYNEIKKFNQEWFGINKEICFVEPVLSLQGAYCMQDRIRELENMYLVARNATIGESCFYENPRDMSTHNQACYFYGELIECLDETRPFNCMENVLSTVLADNDYANNSNKQAIEPVLYSCESGKQKQGLLALFPVSEMPFVVLYKVPVSQMHRGKIRLSQAYRQKKGQSLYMYPENRGAFYSESIFEVLGRSERGSCFMERNDGAVYIAEDGMQYDCRIAK